MRVILLEFEELSYDLSHIFISILLEKCHDMYLLENRRYISVSVLVIYDHVAYVLSNTLIL